ncbi:MAG: MotE family protein [Rhizobiaceae bacterium]
MRHEPGRRRLALLAAFAAATMIVVTGAVAEDAHGKKPAASVAPQTEDEIRQFCANIAEPARERRYAMKAAELRKLQEDVEARIAVLEEKSAEFAKWAARREAFMQRADESLIAIYAKMRPDAAAVRLELLGTDLSAAILMKLSPRQAGVILNEMDATKAASITALMSASASRRDPS